MSDADFIGSPRFASVAQTFRVVAVAGGDDRANEFPRIALGGRKFKRRPRQGDAALGFDQLPDQPPGRFAKDGSAATVKFRLVGWWFAERQDVFRRRCFRTK